jgi:hypothetical protein
MIQLVLMSLGTKMHIQEAKAYANKRVELSWIDRKGEAICEVVDVYEVSFVPLYGPCMITGAGEIRLDRIQACVLIEPAKIAS